MVKVELKKGIQAKILKMWDGTKKQKGVRNYRKIAEFFSVPRRQVASILELNDRTHYSDAIYQ